MVPPRLARLPLRTDGVAYVFVARTWRARLLGLALLPSMPAECALLLPSCSSVHTFGMRFALDIAFLDDHGRVLRIARNVGPRRVLRERGASQVLEWPADSRQVEPGWHFTPAA